MGLVTDALLPVGTTVALFFIAIYLYFRKKYSYWAERKVPFVKPRFPFGNMIFKKYFAGVFEEIYREHSHEPVLGIWMMHRPNLMINDPELIKRILVQDFSSFPDHGIYANLKDDPLANNLFSMHGSQWRNLRAKLTPTFTSGKMKAMFPIVEEISNNLIKIVDPLAGQEGIAEMKDLMGRYSTDIIASCAYGIATNSLENPNSLFRSMGLRFFQPTVPNLLKNITTFLFPDVAKILKLVQTDKQLSDFFLNVVKENIEYRERNNVEKKDFLQLLIQLTNKGIVGNIDDKNITGDPFTFELAAAQAFSFFLGGFETSSGSLQFSLYELAKNQDVQDKLRKEIFEELEKRDGKMTYDGLFSLNYLGMVLKETQRKYPQGIALLRQCKADYPIPGSHIVIEKGTPIIIPNSGLLHDPRYYPNPMEFQPERFTEEEIAKRHKFVYLPFGEGPRACIGQRFAYMTMRAALFTLIARYKFEFCDKTPRKIEFNPKSFVSVPIGGMHLKMSKVR